MRLPGCALDGSTAASLVEWQREIDSVATYDGRVELAGRRFKSRNTIGNATFDAVKASLAEMCAGARRCAYCEDSIADEVEHVRPKSLYPEQVFVWSNYVYACGNCNVPKNSRFEVFVTSSDVPLVVTRGRGAAVLPPVPGDMVLIDPRVEDATSFLELDLAGTWLFNPVRGLSVRDDWRARTTIDLLALNRRDFLLKAREQYFIDYLRHLEAYVTAKGRAAGVEELADRRRRLVQRGHPTVWFEMRRQRTSFPALRELFELAPELV